MRIYDKHVYLHLKEKSRACFTRPQKKIIEIDRGYKDRCQIYLYINLSYISTTYADTHCHKDTLNTEYTKNFIKSMLLPYTRNQNAHACTGGGRHAIETHIFAHADDLRYKAIKII